LREASLPKRAQSDGVVDPFLVDVDEAASAAFSAPLRGSLLCRPRSSQLISGIHWVVSLRDFNLGP